MLMCYVTVTLFNPRHTRMLYIKYFLPIVTSTIHTNHILPRCLYTGIHCNNCGIVTTVMAGLCSRCQRLPECHTCHRRLTPNCFPNNCSDCCEVKMTHRHYSIHSVYMIHNFLYKMTSEYMHKTRLVFAMSWTELYEKETKAAYQKCRRRCSDGGSHSYDICRRNIWTVRQPEPWGNREHRTTIREPTQVTDYYYYYYYQFK